MAHVLIGFAEALPAPEVFFSLHDAGHCISVFVRYGERPPLARLTQIQTVHDLPAPEIAAEASVTALRRIMDSRDAPDLILPIDDTALWLTNAALPESSRIAGAIGGRAQLSLDKTLQIASAGRAGFRVPETIVVRQSDDLSVDLPFPAIAKPAMAITLKDGRITKEPTHFLPDRMAADQLSQKLELSPTTLLVQPLIHGVGEGLFGFVDSNGVCNWSGHQRLRMMNPHGSGSSACRAQLPDESLILSAEAFLLEANWRGAFMIELLRGSDGTAWFMELNGRMWGSLALARDQGFEYPAWAVSQALEPTYHPPAVSAHKSEAETRHLGRDLLHLLFVLRGPKDTFHQAHWPRLGKSLGDVLLPHRGRRLYNEHPGFPGFAQREALHTIRQALRSR